MGKLLVFLFVIAIVLTTAIEAKKCKPSGRIKGRQAPKDQCGGDDECCHAGKTYTTFKCSPPLTKRTKATLTINNFQKGGDGGGPSECDQKYHSNKTPVVALSTGWFNGMKRCLKNITVYANDRSVKAMVVDECDSTRGCDKEHGFQPPCPNNIVDASQAVWEALGIPKSDWGLYDVFWSDP